MFKKSFLAIAVLGATTFSAQAFTLPHNNTTNPNADAAAGWMVNANFSAVNKELNSQQEKIELNKDAIAANKDAIAANRTRMLSLRTRMPSLLTLRLLRRITRR